MLRRVSENSESTRRQDALRKRAVVPGWAAPGLTLLRLNRSLRERQTEMPHNSKSSS
jgi:hypothetical protein